MQTEPESVTGNSERISRDVNLPVGGVAAVLRLLGDGNTVPFVARYRKEATGSLDEVQIRAIEERSEYITKLETRRASIIESILEQGKLTPELDRAIRGCETKTALEDLYLPYKRKRRTRATTARERGLEPLAAMMMAQPGQPGPQQAASDFVDAEKDVPDQDAALAGARDIVAEVISENAEIRGFVRSKMSEQGRLESKKKRGAGEEVARFEQYLDYSEPVARIPSHRFLAVMRGEREGALSVQITIDSERAHQYVLGQMGFRRGSPWAGELSEAVEDGLKRLLLPSLETEVRADLKARADEDALGVFASNLGNLLLAAPLGGKSVIGIDPGLRTGCKATAVDKTGKLLEHSTLYLTSGAGKLEAAERELTRLAKKHAPFAIAVGNGTGGREAEAFCRKVLRDVGLESVLIVSVNESGASVYSASDVAREEFPDLDLTFRGAVSIARRLQDPLAELVKIDPKAIGVGQYQHDVHQPTLAKRLDHVVESCVNRVGVEVNTASAQLLGYVAGVGPKLAKQVVAHREANGAFEARKTLLKVAGLGAKTFEQAAGFLRVGDAKNPLDSSAVHPERYKLVGKMAADLGVPVSKLVGHKELAERIELRKYVGEGVGEPTLRDIIDELVKPGRDPRKEFEAAKFREDVHTMEDLKEGMRLEGVVTNVTDFGAFVDVGVHQDGLVHISQLADRFVKHPSDVVTVGQKIQITVLEIDLKRKRISLSAKSGAEPSQKPKQERDHSNGRERAQRPSQGQRKSQSRPQKPQQDQTKSGDLRFNPFGKLKK